ncbi:Hypp6315 [Branchiostoma lanceolatum]|uniref:Hypp6315 protein n=1 Tax=Branchiostoma lanceolatum TaxID=7740 RepID=A0A8K0E972_BRALA|nr:Hypp6315 [Branchiostoma lanceolatum]
MQVVKVEMIRNARVQLETPGGNSAHQFLPPHVAPKPPPRIEPPKVKFEEPTLVPAAEPRKVTVGPVGGTKTVTKAVVAEPVRGPKTVVTGPVVESREVSSAGREVSTAGREVSTSGRVVSTAGREVSTKREESRDVSIKRDETRKVFVGPAQVTTKVETVRGDPNVQRHVETGPVEEVREVITDPDGTKRTIIRRRVVKTTKTTTSTPVITKRVETKTQAASANGMMGSDTNNMAAQESPSDDDEELQEFEFLYMQEERDDVQKENTKLKEENTDLEGLSVRSGVTRTAESKMTMSSKKVTSSSGESVAKATKTITRQVTPGDVRVETQIKQARSQDKTSVTKRTT